VSEKRKLFVDIINRLLVQQKLVVAFPENLQDEPPSNSLQETQLIWTDDWLGERK